MSGGLFAFRVYEAARRPLSLPQELRLDMIGTAQMIVNAPPAVARITKAEMNHVRS